MILSRWIPGADEEADSNDYLEPVSFSLVLIWPLPLLRQRQTLLRTGVNEFGREKLPTKEEAGVDGPCRCSMVRCTPLVPTVQTSLSLRLLGSVGGRGHPQPQIPGRWCRSGQRPRW